MLKEKDLTVEIVFGNYREKRYDQSTLHHEMRMNKVSVVSFREEGLFIV